MTETTTQKYYIGDLCYVLTSDDWWTYCAAYDNKPCDTCHEEDGYDPSIWIDPEAGEWEAYLADDGKEPWRPCLAFSTAFGDGCYRDQEGREYCVDSGGIGCIRVDHANPEKLADALERGLGHLHEFEGTLDDLSRDYYEGTITFSDGYTTVEIATGGGYVEEEEEEEEMEPVGV
jgi:hypothetical protein